MATRFPPQLAGSMAGFEVGFMAVAGITVDADITAQDSVSACIRPMGMQRRSAIPLDFMTSTVCGGIIPVAQRLMAIKL